MTRIEGGCLCGAVRYSSPDEPRFAFFCQCRECQRATGTGHNALLVVPADGLTIEGPLKYYDRLKTNGNTASHGFCADCGSPVTSMSSGHPDIRLIAAGSLDDPVLFKPQKVIWTEEAQPWDHLDPALPR